jgi:hypothetical protein
MSGWRRRAWAALCVLGVALQAPLAASQEEERPTRRKRLAEMEEAELSAAGFEWEAQNAREGSLVAGLVALGPGAVFHGIGHLYVGDRDTGWGLLLSEGIGGGVLLAGALLYLGTERGSLPGQAGMGMAQLGGAAFTLGYLGDVIGAFKGSEAELLPLSTPEEGIGAHARYTLLLSPSLRFHNLLTAELDLDFGRVYLRPEVELEPLLLYQRYGGVAGLRVVRGETWNFLALQLRVERASFAPESGGQAIFDGIVHDAVLRAQVETQLSLDLGQLIGHLRHMVYTLTAGVGFADGAGARAALPGTESRAYFVTRSTLALNLTPELLLRPYYIFSETELLRPLDAGFGLFGAELRLRPRKALEVHLDLRGGRGSALGLGLTWWL